MKQIPKNLPIMFMIEIQSNYINLNSDFPYQIKRVLLERVHINIYKSAWKLYNRRMKLTKKIPKNRAFDADSPKATQDFKLSIFVCITLHDRKWLQMEGIAKK